MCCGVMNPNEWITCKNPGPDWKLIVAIVVMVLGVVALMGGLR